MTAKIDEMDFRKVWKRFIAAAIAAAVCAGVLFRLSLWPAIAGYGEGHGHEIGDYLFTSLSAGDKAMAVCAAVLCMAVAAAYWLLMAAWMMQRSRRDGASGTLFGLLTLCFNLFAVAAYFIYRGFSVRCPDCGKIQKRDALYCEYCGAPVRSRCPDCGRIMKLEDSYCSQCGKQL